MASRVVRTDSITLHLTLRVDHIGERFGEVGDQMNGRNSRSSGSVRMTIKGRRPVVVTRVID